METTFEWNGLTLNDQTMRDLRTAPYYWFHVTRVDGLRFSGGIESSLVKVPRQNLSRAGASSHDAKRITFTGILKARNLVTLTNGEDAFEAACWDLELHELEWTWWGHPKTMVWAKVNQPPVMPKEYVRNEYWLAFTLSLVAPDPRTVLATDKTTLYPAWQT